jgi:hypothetical protein
MGQVVGGELLDVRGPSRRVCAWHFVPADIELEGSSWSPECPLADQPEAAASCDELRGLGPRRLDAIWVRSRVKALFAVDSPPEEGRPEKSLMHFGFAAAQHERPDVSYVFECSDYSSASPSLIMQPVPPSALRSGNCYWRNQTYSPTTRIGHYIWARASGCTMAAGTASYSTKSWRTPEGRRRPTRS